MPKTPVAKSGLDANLQSRTRDVKPERSGVLWQGPCAEGPLGGITFSMLSGFLSCRERFRVKYVEGVKPAERFNHRMDYGTMWHLCEEGLAANKPISGCIQLMHDYCLSLLKKFPHSRIDIEHWGNVCATQFPIYVEHWSRHGDVKKRTPLMQEQVFDVPYKLPSGRIVRLRGKFDSVDLIDGGVWLQENKTKADVDVQQIQRQLTFDLQTMLYLIALEGMTGDAWSVRGKTVKKLGSPIKGVRYNVVRRPLSGGKGTIVRHKAKGNKPEETWESYYARVEQVIRDDPGHFFARWNTEIATGDIVRFRRECLDPILEQLCDWYNYIHSTDFLADKLWSGQTDRKSNKHPMNSVHWRTPFGVNFDSLNDYGGDTDAYLDSGSLAGLRKVGTLFEELA